MDECGTFNICYCAEDCLKMENWYLAGIVTFTSPNQETQK